MFRSSWRCSQRVASCSSSGLCWGRASSDPVQARLTQLGTLEGVTSLEEIELQQPIMDRTLRPLMRRLSGIGTRLTSPHRIGRTESKLAEAGYPYGLRTLDFMGLKVVVALLTSGLAFLLFGLAMGDPGTGFMVAPGRPGHRFLHPRLLAEPAHRGTAEGHPAGHPGHP